jgi:F-type H+-transporting ATPase subunit alpha
MEILKQPQYQPLPVEKQILLIYCGTKGYFDQLALDDLNRFERELYQRFDERHADLLKKIRDERTISAETDEQLKKAVGEFTEMFRASAK